MTSKVHILLPVHNRRAITEKFIDCLAAQSYTNYHLILIDDGSTDGTSEMVSARIANLTVLRGAGNWWWAGSLQQGIDWLKINATDDDIVVFINDDVTFAPGFLLKGVQLLDQFGGMLLPQVVNDKTGNIEESGVEADLSRLTFKTATSAARINCLPTRGLFMKLSVVKKVGDFFPRLLPHYLSDYEYTIRAHRLGVPLATTPELVIEFDRGATGYRVFEGESFTDFLKKYFSIKSASNPFYWSTFVLLATPKVNIPWLLLKVWSRSARAILRRSLELLSVDGA
ncbi:glycosyltransferase family 2 protein [Ferrigenium sp. UT5]|uniref:glycosyltransferase family 2 protein n=1 Tax=Ferrigenium sp. UT5 TaxID=3242105 RepID=UPI00354B2F61